MDILIILMEKLTESYHLKYICELFICVKCGARKLQTF